MSIPFNSGTVLQGAGPRSLATSDRLSIICRSFYAFVGLNALFVAYLGLIDPARLARTFTWLVLPPLHARFVGVLYLFGAVYLLSCAAVRRASHADPALVTIFIFTGILGGITFLHLDAFNYNKTPSWIWTIAYVVFPLGSLILIYLMRGEGSATAPEGTPLQGWVRSFLQVQAVAFGVAGVLLLLLPSLMSDAWPWKVTHVLAQSYSCAFLACAWYSWRYAARNRVSDASVFLPALLVLMGGTLAVSLKHHALFSTSNASTWVWFAAFGVFFVGLVGIGATTLMERGGSR